MRSSVAHAERLNLRKNDKSEAIENNSDPATENKNRKREVSSQRKHRTQVIQTILQEMGHDVV